MNEQPTIRNLAPQELSPHPKVKHLVGRWLPSSDAAKALRRSIQERGIVQPLIVTEAGEIMDGVTRWQAAKALQLASIPCLIRSEEEALELCIETELHRRHGTKSQLAFRFAPLIEEAFEARRIDGIASRVSALKQGDYLPSAKSFRSRGKRVEDYAVELNLSPRLLEQSHELHALFESHQETWSWHEDGLAKIGLEPSVELTFRDYFTARILAEEKPMSLGGALAGLKQKLAQEGHLKGKLKGGRPEEQSEQLRLFCETFTTLEKRYEYWTEFDEETRAEAVQAVTVSLAKSPTDFLEKLAAKIKAELSSRKSEAGKA